MKRNTRSGGKSTPAVASASHHPPTTKAKVPPCPRPTANSKNRKTVVTSNNEGQDDYAALTAKIAHLESQLKSKDGNSKANSKAKAAQDHLDAVKQGNLYISQSYRDGG